MTDRELKKCLKKLAIGLLFIIVIISTLVIRILAGKKAELSIHTNAGYVENNLQTLGLDEEEVNEYLSVFGNLMDCDYQENQRKLNMATNFIENLYSSYQVQIDEKGLKTYDADVVNQIISEVNGTNQTKPIEDSEIYEYQKQENVYHQNQILDRIPYCTEIKDTIQNDDKIEIIYTLAIMTKTQMAEYKMGQAVDFEAHTIKAIIRKNDGYEYSKYSVISIEEI